MTKTWRGVACAGLLLAGTALASVWAPADGWARERRHHHDYSEFGPLAVYRNARFGYSLTYPEQLFAPEPESENGDGRKFFSRDRKAKIAVFGAHNVERYNMEEYRKTLLKEFDGYEQVTYSPKGNSWFVLSGFHDGNVYYQKVMFSCENEVVSVLAVTWPVVDRQRYDPVIELLEKNFHPGAGANAPRDCR
jgi:hypothetical protein